MQQVDLLGNFAEFPSCTGVRTSRGYVIGPRVGRTTLYILDLPTLSSARIDPRFRFISHSSQGNTLPIMNSSLANPLLPPLPQTQAPTTVVVQLSAEDRYIEPKVDVLSWVMTILAGTVVGLRIYNKFRRRLRLWWDDYIVIVAWVWMFHRCPQTHEE